MRPILQSCYQAQITFHPVKHQAQRLITWDRWSLDLLLISPSCNLRCHFGEWLCLKPHRASLEWLIANVLSVLLCFDLDLQQVISIYQVNKIDFEIFGLLLLTLFELMQNLKIVFIFLLWRFEFASSGQISPIHTDFSCALVWLFLISLSESVRLDLLLVSSSHRFLLLVFCYMIEVSRFCRLLCQALNSLGSSIGSMIRFTFVNLFLSLSMRRWPRHESYFRFQPRFLSWLSFIFQSFLSQTFLFIQQVQHFLNLASNCCFDFLTDQLWLDHDHFASHGKLSQAFSIQIQFVHLLEFEPN